MKKTLQAAGAMMLVACAGGPPEDTRPLNANEQAIVEADLIRLQAETKIVQELLKSAKPLFNVNNEPLSDNHDLIKDLDTVQADVLFYQEAGRFLVADRSHKTYKAMAHGDWNKSFDNNYIVLDPWEKDGMWHGSSTGIYMHEATHFYSDDTKEHNHIHKTVKEGGYKDRLDYVLTEIDPPYLMDAGLYTFDITVREQMKKICHVSEKLNINIDSVAEESNAKRQTYDLKDDAADELSDLVEGGYEEMIESILANQKHVKIYERLGISQDELRRALENSEELREIYRELVQKELNEVREVCAEYDSEQNILVENAEGQVCFPPESDKNDEASKNKERRDELIPPRPRSW